MASGQGKEEEKEQDKHVDPIPDMRQRQKQVGAPINIEGADPALSPPGEPGRTGEANIGKQVDLINN